MNKIRRKKPTKEEKKKRRKEEKEKCHQKREQLKPTFESKDGKEGVLTCGWWASRKH